MPTLIPPEEVAIDDAADIVRARSAARQIAARIGFGLADQTRLVTAVSELARNVVQYAGRGRCRICDVSDEGRMAVTIMVEDYGPGILDIDKAMADGYSTGGGLGAGLPGTQRLMDSFAIESAPGLTRIAIDMKRKRTIGAR